MRVSFVGQAALALHSVKVKTRRAERHEKVKPQEVKPTAVVTRPLLRAFGLAECRARLAKRYPSMPRRELRSLALLLHKEAWDGRDERAIEKLKAVTRARR